MKKLTFLVILAFGFIHIQTILNAQNKILSGNVFGMASKKPITGVKINEYNHKKNTVVTDNSGFFEIQLKGKKRKIELFYKGYQPTIYSCPPGPPSKKIRIQLYPLNFEEVDTTWRSKKNAISISIMEFIGGAVAIRYERFLKERHSVGLHTSVYLFGYNTFIFDLGSNPVSYKGIKASPFYRYYPSRSNSHGFYLEGKINLGYLNFSTLTYSANSNTYTKNFPINFTTGGAGVAIGWMFRLTKGNHGVGNFSLGVEYFPMDVPMEYEVEYDDHARTYGLNNGWWYITGPGAIFEFKFTMGGIF